MTSTLPSLRQQTPKEIEGILANLALDLLPDPGVGASERESGVKSELNQRLIEEIRISLGLKRDDQTPKAMSKIHSYLAKEIGRAVLDGVDITQVKRRLGERGILAPSLYKIELTDQFVNGSQRQGVDSADVELALQTPDYVDHIVPTGLGMESDKATSLYVKQFRNGGIPANSFSLLVACQRLGFVQRVGDAWRVFHSDVDLSTSRTATDVLRAFVGKYGVEITVGEKTDKFFWYERVPLKSTVTDLVRFDRPANLDMSVSFQRGLVIDGAIEIVYAFAINNTRYEADLLKHGIKTKPVTPKKSKSR